MIKYFFSIANIMCAHFYIFIFTTNNQFKGFIFNIIFKKNLGRGDIVCYFIVLNWCFLKSKKRFTYTLY